MKKIKLLLVTLAVGTMFVGCESTKVNLADYGISAIKEGGKTVYVYDKIEVLEEGKTYTLLDLNRGKQETSFERNCYWFFCYEGDNAYPSGNLELYGEKDELKKKGYWYGEEITLEKLSQDGFKLMWSRDTATIGPYNDKNVKKPVKHKVRSYRYDIIDIASYGISVEKDEYENGYYVYEPEEPEVGKTYAWLNSSMGTSEEKFGDTGVLFCLYEVYKEDGKNYMKQYPSAIIGFFDKSKAPYKYSDGREWTGFDGLTQKGAKYLGTMVDDDNTSKIKYICAWDEFNSEINRTVKHKLCIHACK